jgi:hypothetical protein
MIKGKFLKSHPLFSYFAGDIGFVPAEKAEALIKGGYFLPIPDTIDGVASPAARNDAGGHNGELNTLPEDFPGRDKLFAAGYKKLEEVKAAGENLLEIPGISNTVLKKINKYLDKFVFGE